MEIITINTDGVCEFITHEQEYVDLFTLKTKVGGYIEHLPFPIPGVDVWINEEGKYTCEPNAVATYIMRRVQCIHPDDYIAGTMVFTANDNEGNTLPLTPGQVDAVLDLIEKIG